MPTKPPTPSTDSAARRERIRLAREIALGAPVAALLWLGILRLLTGGWSWAFPALILGFSALVALLLLGPRASGEPARLFWKGLVFCIDFIITRVVCVILFYGLFTPVGLFLRLLGRRPLKMRPDPGAPSYWQKPKPDPETLRRYLRQF